MNLLTWTLFLSPTPIKLKTAKAALQNILLHLGEISSIKKQKPNSEVLTILISAYIWVVKPTCHDVLQVKTIYCCCSRTWSHLASCLLYQGFPGGKKERKGSFVYRLDFALSCISQPGSCSHYFNHSNHLKQLLSSN